MIGCSSIDCNCNSVLIIGMPNIGVKEKTRRGDSFTAECCVQLALELNQTDIEWIADHLNIIKVVRKESRDSIPTVELCSIINVTVDIITHETRLICVTRSNQLNTSSSLSVFDSCEYISIALFFFFVSQLCFAHILCTLFLT